MLRGCFDLAVDVAVKTSFPTARPDEDLSEAACRLDDDGIIVVVDDGMRFKGVVTAEGIARNAVCKGGESLKVKDVMNPDYITIKPGANLDRTLVLMMIYNVKAVPVVDDEGVVVGVLTLPRIAKALHEEVDVEEIPSAG
ncbi:MAG: CBS domain-containing protein [Desulfurococcales archaeon]|nr:CBS domain-containing protein [Desulfurococcales archaeon]